MTHELAARLPRLLLVIPTALPEPETEPAAGLESALRAATRQIIKPLKALARQKRVIFSMAQEPDVTPARLHASDIVLFCRNLEPAADWILRECLAQGLPTVYDLDVNVWDMAQGRAAASNTGAAASPRLQQMERYLRQVDRVRAYSQPLVERASGFNPHVCLVNGCIDLSLAPRPPLAPADGVIRITDVGQQGAQDERFALYQEDLLHLLDVYRENIEVYWWGEAPELLRHHRATRVIERIPDYDQFLHVLSHQGFAVGLAPLTPTAYNLARSNTRLREYGLARLAGIYSDVSVYNTSVEHEKTGLLVRDVPGAWFDALQRLVTDGELRQNIQAAAYRYVDAHYRQELSEREWLALIDEVLAERRSRVQPGAARMPDPDTVEVLKDGLDQAVAEIETLRQQLKAREQELARQEAELKLQLPLARHLAQQMDAYRSHPLRRLVDRVLDRVDYAAAVTPLHNHLHDDSRVFFGPLHGFRLRPSLNLQQVPYMAYPAQLGRPYLRRVSLAPLFELYPRRGVLGLQIYRQGDSPASDLLAAVELPVTDLRVDGAVVFDFPPIAGSNEPLVLRIYARELDVPLRIYEWQRRGLFGLGSLAVRPLIGLDFDTWE